MWDQQSRDVSRSKGLRLLGFELKFILKKLEVIEKYDQQSRDVPRNIGLRLLGFESKFLLRN